MSCQEIAALNDAFRRTLQGGRVLITAGVSALPSILVSQVLHRVCTFDEFSKGNDP